MKKLIGVKAVENRNDSMGTDSTNNQSLLVDTTTNVANDLSVIVNGKKYSLSELSEILKKYEEEEDKKYTTCSVCSKKYLSNNINVCNTNLEREHDFNTSSSFGYSLVPYITGFTINTACGDGRKIHLCDDCIKTLESWINNEISFIAKYNNNPVVPPNLISTTDNSPIVPNIITSITKGE